MNKVIMYVFMFILAGVNAMSSGCKDEAGNEYADGDSFLAADGCNRCVCSNETIACAGMACPEIQVCVHNGIEYEVGVLYQIDCNRCWCLKTGEGAVRQKIKMNKGIFYVFMLVLAVVHASLRGCKDEAGNEYADGDSFLATDRCNGCACSNGTIVCTGMACPEIQVCVHNGIEYQVGELYRDDCNICRCVRNGAGLCSLMLCPKKVCKTEDGKMYAKGEEFLATDGCNRCACTENGSAICTLMACVPPASE